MKKSFNFINAGLVLTLLAAFLLASGCKPPLLPSTNVPATKQNKRIIAFLEQYKAAIEKRSVDAVLDLVAKDFRDNRGSEDPSLQIDYLGLKEKLEKTLPRIKDIRLAMFVQHIQKLANDLYEVVFYFNKQVLMDLPSGEKWLSFKEVSRMVIRERKDPDSPYQFEILKGI